MSKAIISLNRLCKNDATRLFRLFLSDEVSAFYMVPDFKSEEEALALAERICRLSAEGNIYIEGIYLDGSLIGIINETGREDGVIELGYALLPEYFGNGYMTEALSLAIKKHAEAGMRVKAMAFSENLRSQRVMQKCGMKQVECSERVEYRGKSYECVCFLSAL